MSKMGNQKGKESKPNQGQQESVRRRRLALEAGLYRKDRPCEFPVIPPPKALQKCNGLDVVKKSAQRKHKFLFLFPGGLIIRGPGKFGTLDKLDTPNPVLYVEFPEGRLKLFGTLIYPKTKYLTLQYSANRHNVNIADTFETIVVFSEAWWIGTAEENALEKQQDFPVKFQIQEMPFLKSGEGGSVSKVAAVEEKEDEDMEDVSEDAQEKVDAKDRRHSSRLNTGKGKPKYRDDGSEEESDNETSEEGEDEKEGPVFFKSTSNRSAMPSSSRFATDVSGTAAGADGGKASSVVTEKQAARASTKEASNKPRPEALGRNAFSLLMKRSEQNDTPNTSHVPKRPAPHPDDAPEKAAGTRAARVVHGLNVAEQQKASAADARDGDGRKGAKQAVAVEDGERAKDDMQVATTAVPKRRRVGATTSHSSGATTCNASGAGSSSDDCEGKKSATRDSKETIELDSDSEDRAQGVQAKRAGIGGDVPAPLTETSGANKSTSSGLAQSNESGNAHHTTAAASVGGNDNDNEDPFGFKESFAKAETLRKSVASPVKAAASGAALQRTLTTSSADPFSDTAAKTSQSGAKARQAQGTLDLFTRRAAKLPPVASPP